jgi:hypothetical protein
LLTGGSGIGVLADSRIDNAPAPQTVKLAWGVPGNPCAGMRVTRNLITNYSSSNAIPDVAPGEPGNSWSDGIGIGCENAEVTDNEVVDATDAGIILYRSGLDRPQRSVVTGNRVLQAGNSAFAALAIDPFNTGSYVGGESSDFTGTRMDRNLVWTGPHVQYVAAVAVGTRMFKFLCPNWNNRTCPGPNTWVDATGAAVVGNHSGGATVRTQIGVAVSGLQAGTVTGNLDPALVELVPAWNNRCPTGFAVADSPTHASGVLQPHIQASLDGCL